MKRTNRRKIKMTYCLQEEGPVWIPAFEVNGPPWQNTVEPRHSDAPRDWQNYIVLSGHRFKRIPDTTILEKNNQN